MRPSRRALAFVFLLAPPAAAAPLCDRIDALIAAGHAGYEGQVAGPADDAEFLRRACLDLRGSVPTAAEVRAFLADRSADKRERLIDRLLVAPGYARRLAWHFDVTFMERRKDGKVPRAEWEKYLRGAFAADRPYDQLVRDILSADGVDPKARPAAKFVLDRDGEPHLVTRDVGRVFLGRNLQCAQCHDHPSVEGYRQEQYYGLYAFFGRTFLHPKATDSKAVIAEKADGDVNFVSVFDRAKAQKFATPRLPDGEPLPEPKAEKGREYKVPPKGNARPVPAYSRRERLAEALTGPANRAFARTAVNRLWAMMLGRGLVHPLDLDHADNPPSHPELLDLLADEFVAHKYDVKWLLREIALTRTYGRSSVVPVAAADEPPADRYLVAALKPLTPEQMAYAVAAAVDQVDVDAPAAEVKLAGRVTQFRAAFAGPEGEPEDAAAPTLDQVLFVKHGPVLRDLTAAKPGSLAARVAAQADPAKAADELFVSALSRPPTAEEAADVAAALGRAKDRPAAAAELVWALIASGEFRFNH